ncbi:MAG: endonuclease [Oscillibacter sp.]|nr:endonuclease [Oscillibacter sp.]
MEFNESLIQFIKRVESLKDSIQTEEATKTAIIMPFFSLLGYDVFDPKEFAPEYVADVGIKRGEKVDYAILQDGNPVIIIEAKSINRNLEKHDSQLFRYFSTTPAKFAILTNGVRYRFYTDLENQNKMDVLPFLDFDLLHMKESQIEELKRFRKETFSVSKVFDAASLLKYQSRFKGILAEEFQRPSDDFVRFFLQDVYSGMKTQAVLERFRPILQGSMQEFISETMNDKIKTALFAREDSDNPPTPGVSAEPVKESTAKPTRAEMNAYYHLKNLFANYVNLEDITYKKTESYLAVLYKGNVRKWICRLIVNGIQLIVVIPDEDKKEIRCGLANIYEIGNYSRYMLGVISRYTKLLKPIEPAEDMYQVVISRRFSKHTDPNALLEKET